MEELKIAFEYQGEQHKKLSYYNERDEEKCFSLQAKDRFKVSECERQGITLIVIPSEYTYEKPPAMRNFIISELIKHGKYPLS
jgi:hypothetical protein